jgi:hypothetical protein
MFGDQQHKTAGEMDMCLTKLDAAGKPLWVSGFGGSKTDRAYGVITDAAGNAYVTGHFESTDAMANGEKVPNAGNFDAFTAKFAPDGKLLWVRVKGGTEFRLRTRHRHRLEGARRHHRRDRRTVFLHEV